MNRENYRHTLTVAYLTTGLSQSFELAYNYLFFLVLSLEQIGVYGWASAWFMFFNVAVDMGIEPVLIRKFGQGELRLSRAFQAILLLRVPVIVLGFILIVTLYEYRVLNINEYYVILLIGAQVIFNVWDGLFKSWLLANNRQNIVNMINMGFSGLRLAYIGLMFAFSWNSLYYLLIGILIFRTISSVSFCFLAYTGSAGDGTVSAEATVGTIARDLFRAGLSLAGVNTFGIIQNRSDWLLVSGIISTLALASYSLVNKVYETIQLIIGVSLQTIYPWLCRDEENKRNFLLLLVRVVIIAGALLGLCGIFIFPPLIQWMFAGKFMDVELPIQIMMLSASLIAASGVFYHLALSKGLESKLLFVIVIATTLQFVSNLYLIPRFGITGAALGMLVLAVITLTGFTILVQWENLVPRAAIRRILVFLSASILDVTLLLYFNVTAWFLLLVVLVVVAVTGWIFLFENHERRAMMNMANHLTQNFIMSIRGTRFRTYFR